MVKPIGILLLLIIAVGLFAVGRMGAFTSVLVTETPLGPYTLVYQPWQGDYRQSAKIMDEIYSHLKGQGIETLKGFGMYFDDPKTTPAGNLRSVAGCVLDNVVLADSLIEKVKPYRIREFPQQRCLQAVFPYQGKLSVVIGVLKVYPVLLKAAQDKKVAQQGVMEIYDIPGQTILYLMPVSPPEDLIQAYYENSNPQLPQANSTPAADATPIDAQGNSGEAEGNSREAEGQP